MVWMLCLVARLRDLAISSKERKVWKQAGAKLHSILPMVYNEKGKIKVDRPDNTTLHGLKEPLISGDKMQSKPLKLDDFTECG